jgi:ankyrin repeat protein
LENLAQKRQLLILMDTNQTLEDARISHLPFLEVNIKGLNLINLEICHRCHPAIKVLIDRMLNIKHWLSNGKSNRHEHSPAHSTLPPDNSDNALVLLSREKLKETMLELRSKFEHCKDFAVISLPSQIEEARRLFNWTPNVYTPKQAKGLEWDVIVCHRLFAGKDLSEANKKLKVLSHDGKQAAETGEWNRAKKGQEDTTFNELMNSIYTSLSRGKKCAIFIEERQNENQEIYDAIFHDIINENVTIKLEISSCAQWLSVAQKQSSHGNEQQADDIYKRLANDLFQHDAGQPSAFLSMTNSKEGHDKLKGILDSNNATILDKLCGTYDNLFKCKDKSINPWVNLLSTDVGQDIIIILINLRSKGKCKPIIPNQQRHDMLYHATLGNCIRFFNAIIAITKPDFNLRYNDEEKYLLHLAAELGHHELVDVILNKMKTPNVQTKKGSTALHLAVTYGHSNCVDVLLKTKGINPSLKDCQNLTPLDIALDTNNINTIEKLKASGAKQSTPPSSMKTLTTINDKIISELIKHNSKSSTPSTKRIAADKASTSPESTLINAVIKKDSQLVQTLLCQNRFDINAIITKEGYTLLYMAASQGSLDITKMLVENNANINMKAGKDANYGSPLYIATISGHHHIVSYLLGLREIEIETKDINGRTPLVAAANCRHLGSIVSLLLENGANPNAQDAANFTPLHIAVFHGFEEIVVALIKHEKTDVNSTTKDLRTPLHLACMFGHSIIVRDLLNSNKICINQIDITGYTPFFWACKNSFSIILALLLERGDLNVELRGINTYTPLMEVVNNGQLFLTRSLLKKGADPNAQTNIGFGPLHFAAEKGYVDIIKPLMNNKKTDINLKNDNLRTPLHIACINGQYESILQLLCSNKIKINAQDKYGFTALMYSIQQGHLACLKLLVNKDAEIIASNRLSKSFYIDLVKRETIFITSAMDTFINDRFKSDTDLFSIDALELATIFGRKDIIEYLQSVYEEKAFLISTSTPMRFFDTAINQENKADGNDSNDLTRQSESPKPPQSNG